MRATLAEAPKPRSHATLTNPALEKLEATLPKNGSALNRRQAEAVWLLSSVAT